jgi:hypothetical protein
LQGNVMDEVVLAWFRVTIEVCHALW